MAKISSFKFPFAIDKVLQCYSHKVTTGPSTADNLNTLINHTSLRECLESRTRQLSLPNSNINIPGLRHCLPEYQYNTQLFLNKPACNATLTCQNLEILANSRRITQPYHIFTICK